jgi:anthranilate phosphoribosyltransferase
MMSISSYLKIIGRGSKGSGDLSQDQAFEVFSKILSGEVSDLELGAFCIAMRIKGESTPELMGFMHAVKHHLISLETSSKPTIILPSYNGARKQLNLTPLLAGLLVQKGFQVIVQGVIEDPTRVTSYAIFRDLNWPILENSDQFKQMSGLNLPIFCPLQVLSPNLQRMLDLRQQIGLRNSAHVLAKLINPFQQPAWQISNYTHPEYPEKLKEYFLASSSHAILMRGNEGEPTASFQRLPEMHFLNANLTTSVTIEERFEFIPPFTDINAAITADWTSQILAEPTRGPMALIRQAQLINEQVSNFNIH